MILLQAHVPTPIQNRREKIVLLVTTANELIACLRGSHGPVWTPASDRGTPGKSGRSGAVVGGKVGGGDSEYEGVREGEEEHQTMFPTSKSTANSFTLVSCSWSSCSCSKLLT